MPATELELQAASHRHHERWPALARTLKQIADEPACAPANRIAVLFELAAVYRERLQLTVQVVHTLRAILDADPTNQRALAELRAALPGRSDADVSGTLEKSPGSKGRALTKTGATMIAASFIMAIYFRIPGATMHNILQFGGIALGLTGMVMSRWLKI